MRVQEGGKVFVRPDTGETSTQALNAMIGAGMYKGGMAKTSAKELLRNSRDAVMGTGAPAGKAVSINLSPDTRSITIDDLGIGIPPEVMEKNVVNVGQSYKPGAKVVGWGAALKGVFPAAEEIHVSTVGATGQRRELLSGDTAMPGDKVATTVSGTGLGWLEGKGLQVTSEHLADPTIPTGTNFTITFPEGIDLDAEFSNARWQLRETLSKSRLPFPVEVRYEDSPVLASGRPYKTLEKMEIPGAKLEFLESGPTNETSYIWVDVLNDGFFEFNTGISLPRNVELPLYLAVDISPTVQPTDPSGRYPFTLNREALTDRVMDVVTKYIQEDLFMQKVRKEQSRYEAALTSAPKTVGGRYRVIDNTGRLPTDILAEFAAHPAVESLARTIDGSLVHLRDSLARYNPEYLEAEFLGFGVDSDLGAAYRGELIGGSYSNKHPIVVNPLSQIKEIRDNPPAGGLESRAGFTRRLAASITATLIHELTHRLAWSHGGAEGEAFAGRQTRNTSRAYEDGTFDLVVNEIQSKLVETLDGIESIGRPILEASRSLGPRSGGVFGPVISKLEVPAGEWSKLIQGLLP